MIIHTLNEPHEVSRKSCLSSRNEPCRFKCCRFEVIRQIYPSFNITKVKRILKAMGIRSGKINIEEQTFFIGLKNQLIVDETGKSVQDRISNIKSFILRSIRQRKNKMPREPLSECAMRVFSSFLSHRCM
jgi:hypothetical protein